MTNEEAIQTLEWCKEYARDYDWRKDKFIGDKITNIVGKAIDALKTPKNEAHWEETEFDTLVCSQCGGAKHAKSIDWDYCPDCGAKMVKDEDYITPEDKYSKEDIDNAVDMIHDYCAAHHDTCNCCYLAHSIFCDVKNPESWRRFSGEEL